MVLLISPLEAEDRVRSLPRWYRISSGPSNFILWVFRDGSRKRGQGWILNWIEFEIPVLPDESRIDYMMTTLHNCTMMSCNISHHPGSI
jgi:hypothetical protein